METKTSWKRFKDEFSEIRKRELGFSQPLAFTRKFSASETIVKKLDLYAKLNGHEGCVNAVEFNSTGDLLVSGSDDKQVIFWDWAIKSKKFSYSSGHLDNIFQTKIMPYGNDSRIVTSAGDGQVRLGEVSEGGQVETKRLGKHRGCVYKLAVEPGSSNIFYSCGEDGWVQHFDLRCDSATKLFYTSSFPEITPCAPSNIRLNAIVIDPRNPNYLAVAGSDVYARLYDIRKCQWDSSSNLDRPVDTYCPHHLIKDDNVHITGLAYSNTSELLVSYNDEIIYLFQKNMGLGPSPFSLRDEDICRMKDAQYYEGHRNVQTVKGVNFFGPNCEYVVSGSDCGHIYIWKKDHHKPVRMMLGDRRIVNQLEPHPHVPYMATCGIENDVKIWAPMATNVPPLPEDAGQIMEINRRGREDHSRIIFTPDMIMHVVQLQRRQAMPYFERRHTAADFESDDEMPTYLVRDVSSDDDSGGNPRDCNIS